jgi:hypothetical protein
LRGFHESVSELSDLCVLTVYLVVNGSTTCITLSFLLCSICLLQEKEEALEKVISLFCKITRRTGNPARLALTYDSITFTFLDASVLSSCL